MGPPQRDVVLIAGVPGVGKSTLCRELAQTLDPDTLAVDFADLMLEAAQTLSIRDELQYLPIESRKVLFDHARMRVASIANTRGGLFLLEAHFVLRIGHELLQLGDGLLRAVSPRALLLIDAPAPEILRRRSLDAARNRATENEASIREHQAANYLRAIGVCHSRQIPFRVILNSQRDIALRDLGDAVRTVTGRHHLSL